jgi:hypothetical protein
MEVDSNRDWTVVGCGWFGHKTAHPTTSILPHSRARFARKPLWNQAFMSADPNPESSVKIVKTLNFYFLEIYLDMMLPLFSLEYGLSFLHRPSLRQPLMTKQKKGSQLPLNLLVRSKGHQR